MNKKMLIGIVIFTFAFVSFILTSPATSQGTREGNASEIQQLQDEATTLREEAAALRDEATVLRDHRRKNEAMELEDKAMELEVRAMQREGEAHDLLFTADEGSENP